MYVCMYVWACVTDCPGNGPTGSIDLPNKKKPPKS
jgi:hypothetical protein